ncbi:heme-dependent catalase [Tothia fuscella]|uniref:Heme-dependent catalase n=1 Tax=Tothia fuscella TaxID=1048955 RepID=A0A9P4TVU6_9PEZI|nr:heme-dependent catalase [Tothia fuscella]
MSSQYVTPRLPAPGTFVAVTTHSVKGCPIADPNTAQRLGSGNSVNGLILLQDTQLIETHAHFSRERILERVFHAHASGAFGEFEVTHDVSDLTSAAFLSGIGKKTRALLRVSTVAPEAGGADSIRDVRGWGMKLYTEEGNQDFVFNDTPVLFVRDPIKFLSLNHPNYVGSQLHPVAFKGRLGANGYTQHEKWIGEVSGFTSEVTDEDFVQARGLWEVLGRTEGQQDNFVHNLAAHLKPALPIVQMGTFKMFSRVDAKLGRRIEEAVLAR